MCAFFSDRNSALARRSITFIIERSSASRDPTSMPQLAYVTLWPRNGADEVAIVGDVPEESRRFLMDLLDQDFFIVREIEPLNPPENSTPFAMPDFVRNWFESSIWKALWEAAGGCCVEEYLNPNRFLAGLWEPPDFCTIDDLKRFLAGLWEAAGGCCIEEYLNPNRFLAGLWEAVGSCSKSFMGTLWETDGYMEDLCFFPELFAGRFIIVCWF